MNNKKINENSKLKNYTFDIGVSKEEEVISDTDDGAVDSVMESIEDDCEILEEDYMADYSCEQIGEYKATDPQEVYYGKKAFVFNVIVEYDLSFDSAGTNAKAAAKKLKDELCDNYGLDDSDYIYFGVRSKKMQKIIDGLYKDNGENNG